MTNDTLKSRVRISTTLTPQTNELLKEFSQKTDIPISKIIEKAILDYIKGEK